VKHAMMNKTVSTWGAVATAVALGAVLSTATGMAQGRQGGAGPAPAAAPAAGQPDLSNVQVEALHVQGNVWMLTAGGFNSAVSIGPDGILIVDTMLAPLGYKLLAKIKELGGNKPIRMIINTHSHGDHVGGNNTINNAAVSVVAGNFAAQAGDRKAQIFAHENTQNRMATATPPIPSGAMPTDVFFGQEKTIFFNGEAIVMSHQPNAHTDGDIVVFFRRSDVVVTGDVYTNTTFNVFQAAQGGSFQGLINAQNNIIDIAVPKEKEEGGTYVIPGHGRIGDEFDVVDMRDMNTIIRDRFQDAIKRGLTLDQVKAENLVRDYEGRYGAAQGFWTTNSFVEAVYNNLKTPAPARTAR
jgi:cyclase